MPWHLLGMGHAAWNASGLTTVQRAHHKPGRVEEVRRTLLFGRSVQQGSNGHLWRQGGQAAFLATCCCPSRAIAEGRRQLLQDWTRQDYRTGPLALALHLAWSPLLGPPDPDGTLDGSIPPQDPGYDKESTPVGRL